MSIKKVLKLTTFIDKIVIIILLFITTLCFTMFSFMPSKNLSAVIEIDGEIYGIYDLNSSEQIVEIKSNYGYNKIKVGNNSLTALDADCPDKIEVGNTISKNGQVIVCLPNRLMIKIVGEKNKVDGVSY